MLSPADSAQLSAGDSISSTDKAWAEEHDWQCVGMGV